MLSSPSFRCAYQAAGSAIIESTISPPLNASSSRVPGHPQRRAAAAAACRVR